MTFAHFLRIVHVYDEYMIRYIICIAKLLFVLFNSHLPEKLKTFIEGKVDNMHEVFNSGVDALAQVGSTSHSAEFVKLVSTVDELVRKCVRSRPLPELLFVFLLLM